MKLPFRKDAKLVRRDWTWCWCEEMDTYAHFVLPAIGGQTHTITSIGASYQHWKLVGFLTLMQDNVIIGKWYVHGQRDLGPFYFPSGSEVRVTLNMPYESCGKPTAPCLTVFGYTEEETV